MSGEEFVLAVVAMVMGSCVLIVGINKITGLIKAWINNGDNIGGEEFGRLAKAFMQHKKDMERRIANLEAIIAGDEEEKSTSNYPQIEEPGKEGMLSNDLEEKRRVR